MHVASTALEIADRVARKGSVGWSFETLQQLQRYQSTPLARGAGACCLPLCNAFLPASTQGRECVLRTTHAHFTTHPTPSWRK